MILKNTTHYYLQKESFGLVFGCDKFHGYIYGLPTFTVETDHKS